jgi:hypothetical protein
VTEILALPLKLGLDDVDTVTLKLALWLADDELQEDGDTLTFIVDGQEMEISLPLGSNPGDELEIQVDSNERQDETDDLVTKVDLGGGIILELNSIFKLFLCYSFLILPLLLLFLKVLIFS